MNSAQSILKIVCEYLNPKLNSLKGSIEDTIGNSLVALRDENRASAVDVQNRFDIVIERLSKLERAAPNDYGFT